MQTKQATPDELATLYLRGRDVSCPGCGYNRRNGITAACPECDHSIDFENCVAPLSRAVSEAAFNSVATIGVILTVFASLILYGELRYWVTAGDLMTTVVVVSTITLGVVGSGSAYRAKRSSRLRAIKMTCTAIYCSCAMVALFAFLLLLAGITS